MWSVCKALGVLHHSYTRACRWKLTREKVAFPVFDMERGEFGEVHPRVAILASLGGRHKRNSATEISI